MIADLKLTPPVDLPLGVYRHYKGAEYEVLRLARHSETEEWLVVYRQCYGDGSWWVRPLLMFTEQVLVEGEPVARFEYMGAKPERGVD
ncbi:DUF1653 domain-containing protein [Marinospirillum alkaliphilum]|uniref:DUF1653 domain-containing protein n=1 Tax=Marinospirillum alkaliphilum DSM 21637 TaxID=1122209 RepID=A0A1K1UZ20_9GAMM|nr:DUF1653 domain-containing protein [Marinospirillum alkaliphilum]SFX18071.1 Protein of unknown function [Marinospirillum alkaliphilum DSM 21637]